MSVGSLTRDGGPGRFGSLVRGRVLADRTVLTVAVLTALAVGLRFYRLGHQGFWFDEATTALLVHFSPLRSSPLPRS